MKSLSPKTRRLILGIALAATLVLVFLPQEQAPQGIVSPPVTGGPRPAGEGALELDKLRRDATNVKSDNAFASKSWYVAPPPPKYVPPPPPPPPKPVAPPLPFTFVGETRGSDGQPRFFLTKGSKLYSVAPGDVIEGTYRFDGKFGNTLSLTYLPLNIKQTIFLRNVS